LRVRSEFVGAGADYHLPEGNSCRRFGRDLGGWTTDRQQQQTQYAERHQAEQPGGSHASHAGVASSSVFNEIYEVFLDTRAPSNVQSMSYCAQAALRGHR
jgi:hypothetical protein